jgi:poly-gamma-glutamate synthesis protein (capsule biosynthesis protein)
VSNFPHQVQKIVRSINLIIRAYSYLFVAAVFLAACAPSTPLAPTAFPTPVKVSSPTPLPTATLVPATPTLLPSPPPIQLPSPTALPETVLLFTGDINPARCVYTIAQEKNDMAAPYHAVGQILQSADLAIGSLDASISDYNPPSPCAEFHRNLLAPAEVVQGMQWAGFDLMGAATNHVKDCGLQRGCDHESLLDTITHLRSVGIEPVGIGKNLADATTPVIKTINGVRFAFLGFAGINENVFADDVTPGAAPLLKEVYAEAVRRAKEQADVVIALPHWGREFTGAISWEQTRAAEALAEAGAMVIVGNNPHHVQGVERLPSGTLVAYALGNFVFDQEWSDGTLYTIQGFMLKVTFRGAELAEYELIPIRIYDNYQPRLPPPEEAAQILQDVADSLATRPGANR